MKPYIAARGREHVPAFAPPGNIVFLAVDKGTGVPSGDAAAAISEAFIAGTEPGGAVSATQTPPTPDGAEPAIPPALPSPEPH
jgi:hypothetical protein